MISRSGSDKNGRELPPVDLVDRRRLYRNIVWNFTGTVAPLLVAVIAIPILIKDVGAARFGILTLAWMIVGYFSLFDLGLGRALTKLVAERIDTPANGEIPSLIQTALSLMAGLGITGAILVLAISPWLVSSVLQIPAELRSETLSAFYLLAFSIPIVILTTGLRGILEAYQRFGLVNIVRLPLGILTYLGPLAVLPFSNSLPAMVFMLLLARLAAILVYAFVCVFEYPDVRLKLRLDRNLVGLLLSFGGWMTVSNIVGPLLLYLGRLFIVVLLSAEAVAYFVTPYEVVVKLLLIPAVIVGVLFPAFSHLSGSRKTELRLLYRQAMLAVFVIMLPLVAIVFVWAEPALKIWINEEFSTNGYQVAKYLAIGVFINSFGHVAQALIQGRGRPDLTAKLHVAELLFYAPYLYWLVSAFGIVGAAAAWVIRVTISTAALIFMAERCLSRPNEIDVKENR